MSWFSQSSAARPPEASPEQKKLQGYHALAKDALARAAAIDEQRAHGADGGGANATGASGGGGRTMAQRAAALYSVGLDACREGLALRLASASGLSAGADSVAAWRRDLSAWQAAAGGRLRELEAGGAAPLGGPAGGGGGGPRAGARAAGAGGGGGAAAALASVAGMVASAAAHGAQRFQPAPQQQHQQRAAARRAGAAAGPPAAAHSPSAEAERMRRLVLDEVLESPPLVTFADVAGLEGAKRALREAVVLPALRPDLFRGLRAPARGVLLYGPPGNGKTMLCRALAAECAAEFFAVSAASLTGKWMGEGEKMVRALFAAARERAPSVLFFDEVDAILSARGGGSEHEASRRLKTEFLVCFDGMQADTAGGRAAGGGGGGGGAAAGGDGGGGGGDGPRVVVVGATNRPADLDDAVRRRLTQRIYVPLPDAEGRAAILRHLLGGGGGGGSGGGGGAGACAGAGPRSSSTAAAAAAAVAARLTPAEVARIAAATDGYSASDVAALCREAAMAPLRELDGAALRRVSASELRPLRLGDFSAALRSVRPSVAASQLAQYESFTRDFGAV